MNLDELQSVQSRERQASSLQHLRSSFYEEAASYVGELRAERNEVAAASDNPFDDPEVERLSDEIRTAEGTVESIYERRVGKVVKLASIAAADMPYDDGGLTKEEEQLFGRLVEAIEGNRERVLSVLDGESPALDCTHPEDGRSETTSAESSGTGPSGGGGQDDAPGSGPREAPADPSASRNAPGPTNTPDADPSPTGGTSHTGSDAEEGRPTPPGHSVESGDPTPTEAEASGPAADGPSDGNPLDIGSAMGGSESDDPGLTGAGEQTPTPTPSETASRTGGTDPDPDPASGGTATGRDEGDEGDEGNEEGGETGDDEPVERTMVRVTADVGNIFGVDGRSYDLSAEDVVTLPSSNAENLVSRDAAVRLD